jgi:AcrR family transcriptional regulator
MARPARVSPDRILAAAAVEFSTRGYAGAGVDRIARRARVNKAMIYYYFGSKRMLYRTLLRQAFDTVAIRLQAAADLSAGPTEKIESVVAAFAAFVEEQSAFPAIMLREVADGGAHLDAETVRALAGVPAVVARIVKQGAAEGVFRPVHPMAAYFTLIAPIVLYRAGAPLRARLASPPLAGGGELSLGTFVRHLQDSMRLALTAPKAPKRKRT